MAAKREKEADEQRRSATIWTTGGHVFRGLVREDDAERHLRDKLGSASDPTATIDLLEDSGAVTAIVLVHVVAARFRPLA